MHRWTHPQPDPSLAPSRTSSVAEARHKPFKECSTHPDSQPPLCTYVVSLPLYLAFPLSLFPSFPLSLYLSISSNTALPPTRHRYIRPVVAGGVAWVRLPTPVPCGASGCVRRVRCLVCGRTVHAFAWTLHRDWCWSRRMQKGCWLDGRATGAEGEDTGRPSRVGLTVDAADGVLIAYPTRASTSSGPRRACHPRPGERARAPPFPRPTRMPGARTG